MTQRTVLNGILTLNLETPGYGGLLVMHGKNPGGMMRRCRRPTSLLESIRKTRQSG